MMSIVFLFSLQSVANQNKTNYSGFYDPEVVEDLPLNKDVRNSVFKLVILKGARMYGTAYSIHEDVLLTNVHNISQCLIDYGMLDSGYDGSNGPLKCKSLSLVDEKGNELNSVELLGSNSRHNNADKDFAVIKVEGLKANPILLNPNGPQIGSSIFVIGFPSTTFRSPQKLTEKKLDMVNIIDIIFDVEDKIKTMNSNSTSQDLFKSWMTEGFQKLQPLIKWSEFLSGSILGRDWIPFLAWQTEDPILYRKNLIDHIRHLKADAYNFIQLIEKAQLRNRKSILNADDTLKVSKGKISEIFGNAVLAEGDATPGSSGSVVVDTSGSSVGILFQLRRVGKNEHAICLLDAIMTDFESIRFSYCPSLGPTFVSSKVILETIRTWGIDL